MKPRRAPASADPPPVHGGPPSEDEVSDPHLMRALAGGDLGALGVLYDRHRARVRQFLRRAMPGSAEIDDLVHETFLALPQAAPSYDGRRRARPFVIGVAAQMVRRRRRGLARWMEFLQELQDVCLDVAVPPDADYERAEDLAAVDRALARMSEDKRLVYLMVEREEMSGEEVASALAIPIGTVWTRLHHARAALRRSLLKRGKR
jgi:RNA polymerase sigma-70 factor (ECF subfamily)